MKSKSIILFQGDSITDAGRSRENLDDLAMGYAGMAAAFYTAAHQSANLKFVNRGNGGNRVTDLQARWTEDCINIKPDIVSIMIGINDVCHADRLTTEKYETTYREILDRIKKETKAKIILIEPFLLHINENLIPVREDLNTKIEVVRKLVKEYKTYYIPMDKIFQKASKKQPPSFWAVDGVHPGVAGHALMAINLLKTFEKI